MCRPLEYVPLHDWVPPPVRYRPLSKSRTNFPRASTPLAANGVPYSHVFTVKYLRPCPWTVSIPLRHVRSPALSPAVPIFL